MNNLTLIAKHIYHVFKPAFYFTALASIVALALLAGLLPNREPSKAISPAQGQIEAPSEPLPPAAIDPCLSPNVECPDGKGAVPSVEEQIRGIAEETGFQWPDYLVRLSRCESRMNPSATNVNEDAKRTTDRGVFQINSYWHPEVSDECAYEVDCATRWTIDRINAGYQHEWTCDKLI